MAVWQLVTPYTGSAQRSRGPFRAFSAPRAGKMWVMPRSVLQLMRAASCTASLFGDARPRGVGLAMLGARRRCVLHVSRLRLSHEGGYSPARVELSAKPPDGWLVPAPPELPEPDDAFRGLDAAVSDFWRWAFSDLRDNTLRGVLVEFIVAAALGRTATRRKGWDNYDVQSDSGV